MRKHLFLLLVFTLLLSAMLISGCGNNAAPADTEQPAASGEPAADAAAKDSLVVAFVAEPTTLLSWEAADQITQNYCSNIYDTLIFEDADGNMQPGLATEWSYNEDNTQITFTLREDAKFHNGDPVTADDVVFSLNQAIGSKFTARITASMDKCEKIDDTHVMLTLKFPYGVIEGCVSNVNCGIVSQAAYEADPEGFARNPVGSGPYKFVQWNSGEKIMLEAFSDYYRGAAAIKDLTFTIVNDTSAGLIALETGQIDVMVNPATSDYKYIEETEGLQLKTTASSAFFFVGFNMTDGIFAENEVLREAVSYAVDPEAIVLGACDGFGEVVKTAIPNAVKYSPQDFDGYTYDLEKAKALLSDNGFAGTKITIKSMESGFYKPITEIVSEQLRQAGFDVTLELQERTASLADVYTNCMYEICVYSFTAFYPDADFILYNRYHSSYLGGGNNMAMVSIPELDQYLDEGRYSNDDAVRAEAYLHAAEVMRDNYVLVPVLSTLNGLAANADLNGVVAKPMQRVYVYDMSW